MRGQRSARFPQKLRTIQRVRYVLARVLGVDPAFKSVAGALDLVLRERDRVAGSDLRRHAAGRVLERLHPSSFRECRLTSSCHSTRSTPVTASVTGCCEQCRVVR